MSNGVPLSQLSSFQRPMSVVGCSPQNPWSALGSSQILLGKRRAMPFGTQSSKLPTLETKAVAMSTQWRQNLSQSISASSWCPGLCILSILIRGNGQTSNVQKTKHIKQIQAIKKKRNLLHDAIKTRSGVDSWPARGKQTLPTWMKSEVFERFPIAVISLQFPTSRRWLSLLL